MTYTDEILKSMKLLEKNPKSIFLGQSVEYPGNLIYKTLTNVSKKKKLEVPVFEDVQMGLSIGLALGGYLPISTYPRFDFLLLAFFLISFTIFSCSSKVELLEKDSI